MFQHIAPYAGDPILSLVADFNRDPRPNKINLSIGYYYDDQGIVPQLECVKQAIEIISPSQENASLYLPMRGLSSYCSAVHTLLFGENAPAIAEERIATIQSLGGSGALKVGADFLRRSYPQSQVWVSDPTWDNHITIFEGAGFVVNRYPYYDPTTHAVNFEALLACVETLPAKSILLLHPCCHNPTGADLTLAQWETLLTLMKARDLIPFMDIAYQGFGESLDDDAAAIRLMADLGMSGVISNSFSKTFSLYGERVGGLSVLCETPDIAAKVLGQLQFHVRSIYSSPVSYGAHLVSTILNTPELNALWQREVAMMRERILSMRQQMVSVFNEKLPQKKMDFFLTQRGMFSYTGLSAAQVARLKNEKGIYLVGSGRICMSGLNSSNIMPVAEALVQLMQEDGASS